eukprot:765032-Hanusia_phi.AAC.6
MSATLWISPAAGPRRWRCGHWTDPPGRAGPGPRPRPRPRPGTPGPSRLGPIGRRPRVHLGPGTWTESAGPGLLGPDSRRSGPGRGRNPGARSPA